MGTSQSSTGPGGRSPLIPPWADDQPQQPIPTPEVSRFAPYRKSLGSAVATGNRDDYRKAIGHYARKASGGSSNAARRMGSVTKAGAELFGILAGVPSDSDHLSVDLNSLTGLPCEVAIASISQAISSNDGDADQIRVAMNHALVEALDGVETFDPQFITDDIIVNTMIGYLSECIFLKMVMDSDKAWNKAETPSRAIQAETELRELIKVVVDKHMAPKLTSDVRAISRERMTQVERQAIIDVWKEWESYQ